MEENGEGEMSVTVKLLCLGVGFIAICYGIKTTTDWGQNCHSGFSGVRNHFATKTPYIPPPECSLVDPPHLKGCKAEQIWMMVRHGTRNPSSEVIIQMKTLLPKLQAEIIGRPNSICKTNIDEIAAWKLDPNLDESKQKFLVSQGKVELSGLGARYKRRYPNLFDHKYDNSTFKFKFTKTERAEASARAFVKSLFDEEEQKDVYYPEALDADPVLRFYKNCPKWKKEVDKNPATYAEQTDFTESQHMKLVLENTRQLLGLERNLTFEELEIMYTTCAFETAWNPDKLSPWCSIFDESAVLALEYHQDLDHYWSDGYGYEITYKQACPPVKDVIDSFQNKIDNPEESPNVIAYFTHSGTQLKLLARLGFFKDDRPLKSDNYVSHVNRNWRTRSIDKFATNLALVLHKCPTDYMISAFFQELPIKIPACDDLACKFQDFKSKISDIVEKCDVPAFCKI